LNKKGREDENKSHGEEWKISQRRQRQGKLATYGGSREFAVKPAISSFFETGGKSAIRRTGGLRYKN
jgi:hypothetical protein